MTDWPSRTWSKYPGPNRCEAGCGRPATLLLTWERGQGRVERYCDACAVKEEIELEACGAERLSLASLIGASAPQTDEPAGGYDASGLGINHSRSCDEHE